MSNLKHSLIVIILVACAIAFLVYNGIAVIQTSNDVYNTTVRVAEASKAPDKICTSCIKDGYAQALLFFSLALGIVLLLLLLPRLQSIGFGGFSIALKDLQDDIENLKTQNNVAQEKLVDTGGGSRLTAEKLQKLKQQVINKKVEISKLVDPDDPQKGKWGGAPEARGRKLSATVSPSPVPSLYRVILIVESTDSKDPLKGFVCFHLHPTFKNQDPIIAVKDGKAELKLNWVYGAFTVGAEADEGKTRLELDLANDNVPGVTEEFKSN